MKFAATLIASLTKPNTAGDTVYERRLQKLTQAVQRSGRARQVAPSAFRFSRASA